MKPISEMTETELRDTKVPRPKDLEELVAYIDALVERKHDYGTCVYAMSMAAEAAFNYVAHKLGVSGFQASCADLDILRRTRSIEGPFKLVDLERALYPQYDLIEDLRKFINSEFSQKWLQEQAQFKLENNENFHPEVKAHLVKLAGQTKCPS